MFCYEYNASMGVSTTGKVGKLSPPGFCSLKFTGEFPQQKSGSDLTVTLSGSVFAFCVHKNLATPEKSGPNPQTSVFGRATLDSNSEEISSSYVPGFPSSPEAADTPLNASIKIKPPNALWLRSLSKCPETPKDEVNEKDL